MAGKQYSMEFQLTADAGKLSGEFKKAQSEMKNLQNEIQALNRTQGDISSYEKQAARMDATSEKLQRLQKEYDNVQKEISETEGFSSSLQNRLLGKEAQITKTTAALNDQTGRYEELGTSLKEAGVDTDDLAGSSERLAGEVDGLKSKQEQVSESTKKMGNESRNAAEGLEQILVAVGALKAVKKVAEFFVDCAKASVEFESAMAGVAKTTDLSAAGLAEMADDLQRMSTEMPVAATELAGVAETAGQLGIAEKDIVSFTEVMANLGVSTNLSATDAASALAKFANVTGMSAKDYERLGSVVVALGNNFATTESDIVNMATRLSATGGIIGLTEAEIMGISAALSSVGMEAEAGGSAISKILTEFETMVATGSEKLTDFAEVAGMSSEEFSTAWEQDAMGALAAFLSGLKDLDSAGGSSIATLSKLGVTNINTSKAVLSLSNAGDVLKKSVNLANAAWQTNTALTQEAAIRYGTTESKLKMLENASTNLKGTIGGQLTPAIGNLADAGKHVLGFLDRGIEQFGFIVPVVTGAAVGIGALTVATAGYKLITTAADIAQKAFNTSLLASPIGWISAAVSIATAAFVGISSAVASSKAEMDALTVSADALGGELAKSQEVYDDTESAVGGAVAAAQPYIDNLAAIEKESLAAGKATDEYTAHVGRIQALLPGANLVIDEATGLLKGNAAAASSAADSWKTMALETAIMEKYEGDMKAWAAAEVELTGNRMDRDAAVSKGIELEKEQGKLLVDQVRYENEMKSVMDDTTLSTEQKTAKMDILNSKYWDASKKIGDLTTQIFDNEDSQKKANAAVLEGEETMGAYEDSVAKAEGQLAEFYEKQKKAGETTDETGKSLAEQAEELQAVADKYGVTTDAVLKYMEAEDASLEDFDTAMAQKQLDELAEAYQQVYESALTSIQGQMSLWDQFDPLKNADGSTMTMSMEELSTALTSQMTHWDTYNANLAQLSDRTSDIEGLGEMVNRYADGSKEGALAIAAMAGATDAELAAMVTSFMALETSQGNTATATADLEGEFGKLSERLADTENSKMFFDSLKGGTEEAGGAIEEFSQKVETGMVQVLTAMDKSEEARTRGTSTMQGFIDGANSLLGSVGISFEVLAAGGVVRLDKSAEAHMKGRNTIQGFIFGSESMRSSVISTYSSLAQAAMNAFDVKLDINSPSKEMAWRGEMSMLGFINQTEAMQPEVQAAMAESAAVGLEAFSAKESQLIAFAPEVMRHMSSRKPEAVGVNYGGATDNGVYVNINISPTYGNVNASSAEAVNAVYRENNENLKELVIDALQEIGIDKERVAFR